MLSVASACLAGATAAYAQDQELEQIIVTGSRIARPDFESASPIVTIAQDRFQQAASATLESTLNSLPQFVGSWGSTSNNPSARGQAQASLRGLNNSATLVLVDSRRLIPANGYGVPDLNLIPPALIERVEVLTGGASAVYGSDALAGVVNLRLLDRYEGLEFGGDWGMTDVGDGDSYTATLTGGTSFAAGRGSFMGSVGYSQRDQVDQGDRRFSRVSVRYYGPGTDGVGPGGQFLPLGSFNIEEGRATFPAGEEAFNTLFARYGYPAGTVPYQTDLGFNSDGTLFTMGNDDPGSVANFRGVQDPLTYSDRAYSYNFAPPNALQMPLDRTSVFVSGSFEFNESAELYAQGIYGDYSVDQQLAPSPVTRVYMPPTNPYISPDLKFLLDSREDPAARLRFSKRTLELGPRVTENDYSTYQVTLGLRGKVLSDWDYNAYAQFGQSDQTVISTGNVSVSKFEELLYAPDGGQSICGGLDPFGLGSISAECARYMAVDLRDRADTQQLTAEFSLSGSPLDLPAGALSTVFGLFYKKDTYSQRPDPAAGVFLPDGRTDISGSFGGATAMDADDHNVDAYVEALVPLLADLPGVRSLQTVLGYRYSDYASAGGTSSYKAELLYEPVDPVHLRGSFQHAVRAPSVFELYDPQLPGFPYIDPPDPCSVGSESRTGPNAAAVESLCLAQGISADLMATFNYDDYLVEGFYGGNPDLKPEKARTYTAGVVFDSPFSYRAIKSLQVSLDWWDIRITDAINVFSAASFVANCYDPRFNPNFDVSSHYCSYFSRDLETGAIVDAYQINRNIAVTETSGVDLQLDWRMGAGPGEVGVTWMVSWLDSYEFQESSDVKPDQWAHKGCCPTLPEWKWNLDARYRIGSLTVGAIWAYVGTFQDYWERTFEVPAKNFVDLTTAYEFEEGIFDGLTLRIGVTNVFDEEPPIFPSWEQANTAPSIYDVLGRRYFVSLNYAIKPGTK